VKKRIPHPATGEVVEADVIEIQDSTNTVIRVTLADGSVLRVRLDIIEVVRYDGLWDNDGNPVYSVKNAVYSAVLQSPDSLRKEDG